MINALMEITESRIQGIWANVDILIGYQNICSSDSGKATYQSGINVWKTKALILGDRLARFKAALEK